VAKITWKFNIHNWKLQRSLWVYVEKKLLLKMQPKGWKNLSFWIFLLASISVNSYGTGVDAACAKNPNLRSRKDDLVSTITSLAVVDQEHRSTKVEESVKFYSFGKPLVSSKIKHKSCESSSLHSQIPSNQTLQAPPLEGQATDDFPGTSPTQIERRLQVPHVIDFTERRQRLLRRLQEKKQLPSETNSSGELGKLFLRQRQLEQLPNPRLAPLEPESKPIGYLLAHLGYFQTSNIFSSVTPKQDGLIFSGLTLASAPLPLGSKTYLNGSIDGNLIRYINQSKYNYSQVRFNLDIYKQLTPRMYGDFGWSNQQLFYATKISNFSAGDRFLNENSLRLSLGRRDPITPKLMLDSFYELRMSFTDPPNGRDSRNRVINSLWVSLDYYWQKSLQVGLDYQFGLSNFTEIQREDQYHRLFGHLTYGISNYSNISLESGVTLGSSTDQKIDFNGWFFTLNYNWELGRF